MLLVSHVKRPGMSLRLYDKLLLLKLVARLNDYVCIYFYTLKYSYVPKLELSTK
jgi:hypothetical protein